MSKIVIFGFLIFRPIFASTSLLRLGEATSIFVAILYSALRKGSRYVPRYPFYLTSVCLICAFFSVAFSPIPQTFADYADISRTTFPLIFFLLGRSMRPGGSFNWYRKALSIILILQAMLVFLQHTNILGQEFDLVFNVKELSYWNKSAGSFSNHIEPSWFFICLLAVYIKFEKNRAKYLLLPLLSMFVFYFTESKTTIIIGVLMLYVILTYRSSMLQKIWIIFLSVNAIALITLMTPYFSNTFSRLLAGNFSDDPSTYIRFLDYIFIYNQLTNFQNVFSGFGKSTLADDFSYMGTSFTMWIFRYGVLVLLLYYINVYLIIKKCFNAGPAANYMLIIIFLFNLISNGDEALKGLFLFFTTVGLLSGEKNHGDKCSNHCHKLQL